jgi:hypothetical protein
MSMHPTDPKKIQELNEFAKDLNVFALQELKDIKRRPDLLCRIRFDVTPQMIMAPRVGPEAVGDTVGCSFYIETHEAPPALMLMKVGKQGVISTVGKIDEIPAEMLKRAIDSPPAPPANEMYAITGEIEEWLKNELPLVALEDD